jgi:hypothetical protein
MVNYFQLLALPAQPHLAAETLRAAFQQARATAGLSSEAQQLLQEAWQKLERPSTRLAHLLALHGGTAPRGATISEPMVKLFSEMTPALQAADTLIAKKSQTSSALAKALLAKQSLQLEGQLQDLGGAVMELCNQEETALEQWDGKDLGTLSAAQQAFAFLEKWDLQLQARRLALAD